MGFVARLRRGTNIINLNASPFTLSADWVPPTAAEVPTIAENRSMKARRTGENNSTQGISAPIHVQGSSVAHIRGNVDNINSFLKQAGQADKPIYFEWRPDNYISAEPVWGQFGAYRSVEILWGAMSYGDQYGIWDHSQIVTDCPLSMVVAPAIEGKRQKLAVAKGCVIENWIGKPDGMSRGTIIARGDASNGNKITNPVFGNATYDTGWTAATIAGVKNTDPDYVLFGLNSVYLYASADGTYTQSIDVGNTNTHVISCYVKRPGGAAPTSSVIKLYYNATEVTTTYDSVGNGWYRIYGTVTGVASAVTAGVKLFANYTIYADGFQLEERTTLTPFFYGDMLGCSWNGTAHASKSLRTAGRLAIPTTDIFKDFGTLRIVWRAGHDNGNGAVLFHDDTNYSASYTSPTWTFEIKSGLSLTFSDTFSPGDYLVFHLVWSKAAGVAVYLDGVSKDTDSYSPPGVKSNLFIGSDGTPANHIGGSFVDVSVYQYAMSATEVLADYNNISPILTAEGALGSLPYIWTKDGDGIVDYIDSGSYRNIAIIGGVSGSLRAKTEIKATVAGMNNPDVYIGDLDFEYRKYLDPEFLSYIPGSPPDTISLDTSDTTLATISLDDDEFELISGKVIAMLLRVDDDTSGNNVVIKTGINPGGAYYYSHQLATVWATSSTDASFDLTPENIVVPNEDLYRELGITRALAIRAVGKRLSGSALDFKLHSAQIFPFPMIRLVNTSASGIAPTILYLDGRAYEVNSSAMSYTYSVTGSKNTFGLLPGRYNLLVSAIGKEGVATDSSDTLTYNAVYITPRWAIL